MHIDQSIMHVTDCSPPHHTVSMCPATLLTVALSAIVLSKRPPHCPQSQLLVRRLTDHHRKHLCTHEEAVHQSLGHTDVSEYEVLMKISLNAVLRRTVDNRDRAHSLNTMPNLIRLSDPLTRYTAQEGKGYPTDHTRPWGRHNPRGPVRSSLQVSVPTRATLSPSLPACLSACVFMYCRYVCLGLKCLMSLSLCFYVL